MSALSASQALLNSPEYSVLTQYPSSSFSTQSAAQDAFCETIENKYMARRNPSEIEVKMWTAWQTVVAMAADPSISNDQRQKLADFILGLQSRRTLKSNGQVCDVQGMTVWKDLPIFGWKMREAWNFAAGNNDNNTAKQEWININAWTGMLAARAHSLTRDMPDESIFCIWTVRMALEGTGLPSNVALSAAAVWFINAASAIWDFCKQNKSFNGRAAAPGKLFNNSGWRGFTTNRWRAWAKSFSDVQGQVADAQTSELVQQAREAMENVVEPQ